MTQPELKGVIFDLDDTLIDWSRFNGNWASMERRPLQAVYDFVAEQGRPLSTTFERFTTVYTSRVQDEWAEARNTLRSPHLGRILMNVLAEFGCEEDDTFGMAECLRAYEWGPVNGVTVFEEVPEVLQMLVDREVPIGIVTNSFQPMLLRDRELKAFDLLKYFPLRERRISAADVGYLKPHPAIFEHALEQLDAQPEEAIYIGDNPTADIAGAQSAGMKAILRIKRPAPSLISGLIVPDAAINSLIELEAILDDWYPEW